MRASEFAEDLLNHGTRRAPRAGSRPPRGHEPVPQYRSQEEQLDELTFLGSECTKDCSGHRAGYAWFKRKGRDPMSWSPSFNKGAALAKAGR